MLSTKRLSKEIQKLHKTTPEGVSLVSAPDLKDWELDLCVLDNNPIYTGQVFRLRFRFSDGYPIEAPEIQFLRIKNPDRPIPLHPHVYSNGVICLDLLGTGWSPAQNVESVCMSLQSMLTGNTKAERPEGDEEFCKRTGGMGAAGMSRGRVRALGFIYDDDTV